MTAIAASGRVLVLSKNWTPINVISVFKALHKVCNERALFVDPLTYQTFKFEEWTNTWEDAIQTAKIEANRVIHLCGNGILAPEVIVATKYAGFGYKTSDHRKPKFSRSNLYTRDRGVCQFCSKKLPSSELTMDHIVPRSKGGKVTWTNIVLACVDCNLKKGNKSLKDSGLRLIRQPFEPKAGDLKRSPIDRILRKIGNRRFPKAWEQFLGKAGIDNILSDMYWNVELKE